MRLFFLAALCSLWAAGAVFAFDEHALIRAPAAELAGYNNAWYWNTKTLPLAARVGGQTLYSRDVNRVLCVASPGAKTGVTWLGTALGVKQVDRRRKTVRHFTTRDGLPGNRVTALIAEKSAAWCVVSVSATASAVCAFDAKAGRWTTLPPTIPAPHAVLALTRRWVCVAPRPVLFRDGAPPPALLLWEKSGKRAREIPWDPALRADHRSIFVSFALAENDTVWLGTDVGLLRCHLEAPRWERFLPDRSLAAGVTGRDGAFWLAGTFRQMPRYPQPRAWSLLRFVPHTGAVQERALPSPPLAAAPAAAPPAITPAGVAYGDDNTVWLTARRGDTGADLFFRFDPPADAWRVVTSPAEAPDVVLLAPRDGNGGAGGPLGTLVAAGHPDRFPDWFCAGEPLPAGVSDLPFVRTDPAAFSKAPLFPADLPLVRRPNVSAVALVNDTVYAHQLNGLWALDPQAGSWRVVVPSDTKSRRYGDEGGRLIARNGRLWRAKEGGGKITVATVRGDANEPAVTTITGGTLEEINDQGVWLLQQSGQRKHRQWNEDLWQFVRFDPETGAGEPLAPPPADALPTADPDEPLRPRALSGDMAWFEVIGRVAPPPPKAEQTDEPSDSAPFSCAAASLPPGATRFSGDMGVMINDPRPRFLVGYDTRTKTWTTPLHAASYARDFSALPDGPNYLVMTGSSPEVVRRYDVGARRWAVAAPPALELAPERGLFGGGGGFSSVQLSLKLVSADADTIWCYAPNNPALWKYSRREGVWTGHQSPAPAGHYNRVPTTLAARAAKNDALFIATGNGLWRYQVAAGQWRSFPVSGTSGDLETRVVGDTSAARWLSAQDAATGHYAARFLKRTGTWMLYGQESGFPSGGSLIPDGASAWSVTSNTTGLYRFNGAGAWCDVSQRLSPAFAARPPRINRVVPDGGGAFVYLLLEEPASGNETKAAGQLARTPPVTLVRYNKARDTFDDLSPPVTAWPGSRAAGRAIRVEPGALYLETTMGRYRFDIAAQTWRNSSVSGAPGAGYTAAIERRGDTVWFVGSDSAFGWKDERANEPVISAPAFRRSDR